ncbi:MAG: hypothetical protein ACXVMS_08650 [Flavisolibacter sp.]
MKKYLLLLWCLGMLMVSKAQNTDLPGPSPNLQLLPSGSYVIAMDNTLQVNSSGDFNLKAYGLVVYLLNNSVRVKWSIKAGKAKDGVDFTALAEQLKPTLVAGGVSRNFKAGPFVISAADTTGVASLIDAFYTTNALTGLNRPQVYRLTADAPDVDIRYDLTAFRPKAAVLTDGGNQSIHLAYMTAAAIPAASYATSAGSDLLTNCFTFASEPHNTNTGTAVNNAISSIRDFVTKGGNFLAQCEAINNYENNSLGRFQTTMGVTIANVNVGTTLNYPGPDLSFSQYEGAYNASQGGSLKNWKISGSPINNEHDHATGTGSSSNVIGASVAKLFYGKGGLVFYVGNHSFATTSQAGINGIRMYMNAFLTPSNTNCPILTYVPLAVKLLDFTLTTGNQGNRFSWKVSENESAHSFTLEQSRDGRIFSPVRTLRATLKRGEESYGLTDPLQTGKVFYRLKMVDRQDHEQYSAILSFDGGKEGLTEWTLVQNPVHGDLVVRYTCPKNTALGIELYNALNEPVYHTSKILAGGSSLLVIPASMMKQKGLYFLELVDADGKRSAVKVLCL